MEKTELKSLLGAIVDSLDNKKSQEDKTPKIIANLLRLSHGRRM